MFRLEEEEAAMTHRVGQDLVSVGLFSKRKAVVILHPDLWLQV